MQDLMIMVAPNGARQGPQEHPQLPITIAHTAIVAKQCFDAGACMMHAHIRDECGKHLLDTGVYRELLQELHRQVPDMLIQITTESVGRYSAQQQIDLVQQLQPNLASVALRELVPNSASEGTAKAFFNWAEEASIHLQIILYDVADVLYLQQLRNTGVISHVYSCVLYVLGRYHQQQLADPNELQVMLDVAMGNEPWFICAFGYQELACMQQAIKLGGHARVGFENNIYLSEHEMATDNAQLVSATVTAAKLRQRSIASPLVARQLLGIDD